MADLQQTRYDKLLRRSSNIVGAGAIVTETLQEVFPVFDLENVPSELLILGGWRMAHRGTDIDPGVGNPHASQLFNPTDSGQVMVLTQVIVSVAAASDLGFGLFNAAILNSNGFGQYRDARAGDPITSAAVGNTRIENSLVITVLNKILATAAQPYTMKDPNGVAVILPGNGFVIQNATTDVRTVISYFWRERTLEAAETNL